MDNDARDDLYIVPRLIMDEVISLALWIIESELWTGNNYPYKKTGLVSKGSKLYIFPTDQVQELKRLVQLALESEAPETLAEFRFDYTAIANRPGEQPDLSEIMDRVITVPESVFTTLLLRFVRDGDSPVFGWVTWSYDMVPRLLLRTIEISFMEIADGEAFGERSCVFTDNVSIHELCESLIKMLEQEPDSPGKKKQVRFWNVVRDGGVERIINSLRDGMKLKWLSDLVLLEESNEPMLKSLQSLLIIIEVKNLKKIRAFLKGVNPFKTQIPKRDNKVGLKNLGNTCYLNCILQCLAHIPELAVYYRNTEHDQDVKPMSNSVATLVKEMYAPDSFEAAPDQVYSALMDWMPKYRDFEQQDSEELFLNLVQCLIHEESEEVRCSLECRREDVVTWVKSIADSFCLVSMLFSGMALNTVKCCNCQEVTASRVSFYSLPLILCPSRRYLIYLIYIDPAAPSIRFSIDSPTPFEENESLLAIRNYISEIKGIQNFEIGEYDNGLFKGPIGLTNIPNSHTLVVMQLPDYFEEQVNIFCDLSHKGRYLSTRILTCTRSDLLQDLPLLLAQYLVSAGSSAYFSSGSLSQFVTIPVTESDVVEITVAAHVSMWLNSVLLDLNRVCEEWSIRTVGELAELCEGAVKLFVAFSDLPKIVEKSLQTYKPEKPVVLPRYNEKKLTLTITQLLEYTLLDKPQNEEDSFPCPVCKDKTQHVVGQQVQRLPKILTLPLQLARLVQGRVEKSLIHIYFSLVNLDLSRFETGPAYNPPIYDLAAVVCHKGKETTKGHYVAYAKHPATGQWYLYNDTQIKTVTAMEVLDASGVYLLFYERR